MSHREWQGCDCFAHIGLIFCRSLNLNGDCMWDIPDAILICSPFVSTGTIAAPQYANGAAMFGIPPTGFAAMASGPLAGFNGYPPTYQGLACHLLPMHLLACHCVCFRFAIES